VIFVGEMRDCGTTEIAITAAGIDNLVLSTLHTVEKLGPGRLGTYSRSTWQ
jgi:Tfp pilus assembly pilus retraction ATPase PilT